MDLDTWKKAIGGAVSEQITTQFAIKFAHKFSREQISETLLENWISYQVRIGAKNDVVNPMSLLETNFIEQGDTFSEGAEVQAHETWRLYIKILAGYRYGLASEVVAGDYKSGILTRINMVVRNEPFNLLTDLTPTEMDDHKIWYNNAEFRAIVGALDMFWCKFPSSQYAQLRVCTLSTRFKDCSSISELTHLSTVSSMKIGDILKYVFLARVRDEVIAIGREGEEISKPDSYFPYMRELRMSKKSPYSSTQNVNLHNWISMFCTFLGSTRSYNARLVSETGLLQTMNLALFAAYPFRKFAAAKIVFGDEDDAAAARDLEHHGGSNDEFGEFELDPNSPLGVYQNIRANKGEVPEEIIVLFRSVLAKMDAPRDKTIRQFLRKNLN